MKKNYVKPELFYESFVLSQHIALCNYQLNHAIDGCAIITDRVDDEIPAKGGFINQHTCDFDFQVICYTNGTIESNVFNS